MTLKISRRAGLSASRRAWLLLRLALASVPLALVIASPPTAAAAAESPWWHLSTRMFPSHLAPGGEATVVLEALNVGDGPATGVPALTESFPAGVTVQSIEFYVLTITSGTRNIANSSSRELGEPYCKSTGSSAQCRMPLNELAFAERGMPQLNPYEDLEMRVTVKNEDANASDAQMSGEVTGGEAPRATIAQPLSISEAAPAFGAEHFSVVPEEHGGGVDVQAGSHPFQLTSTLTLNESADQTKPLAMPRSLDIKLPPGLVGNASRLPQCTEADFNAPLPGTDVGTTVNRCSAATVLGVASVTVDEPNLFGVLTASVPLFNLAPERGEPARFGFEVLHSPVILDTSVRTGGDYGVTVKANYISELVAFISSTVTFWGVPGDERHDASRGWSCLIAGKAYRPGGEAPPCVPAKQSQPSALLTLPTACVPFHASVTGSSWPSSTAPGGLGLPETGYGLTDEFGRELGITGCGQLRFEPSLDITPEVPRPASPSGLLVHLHMPQEADETPHGLAEATIKDLSITLPEGVTLNAASAGGLQACSELAADYLAEQSTPPGSLSFTPSLPSGWEAAEGGFCPTASKIGTVTINSRLLPPGQTLKGAVYLAAQNANPFGSLLALYLVAEDPVSGVAVKLAGQVSPDPATGQLTTTFRNLPQLPFEDATVRFFGGPQAPLATPPLCGSYRTTASLTPWSQNTQATPESTFTIAEPSGSACPSSRPFAPALSAAPQSIQAGEFTPLSTTIALPSGSQDIQSVTLQMPPGFSGMLPGIRLCPTAQADAGTCSPESRIGQATANIGVGHEPFEVTGGEVFLTEGYGGASFGLSIVAPAKAGPFDLGTIVVRARVSVDTRTAQLTIATDASGPHAIPRILDGIPLEIQRVNVTIDRSGFTFNPTNCSPLGISGSSTSADGAVAQLAAPYQVANCSTLRFAPKFSVTTSGKTSKARGASLVAKLTMPSRAKGAYANLAKVKVSLPKQLPSRLTTLQKACQAAVWEAQPTNCPAASVVGHARVVTPTLPVPLTGSAYLVSHGGEAFPALSLVLQGYGVTLDVVGTTLIRKGITSTTFNTVPDVPFSNFELTLPQGRFSALAAHGSLCRNKLTMPSIFYGQNGAVMRQSTRVRVTGCAKKHKRHRGKRHKRHKR
jgi:hypothetical protein